MTGVKKGFTLLELLIVIAILAILASVVFIVLNPAEILRKSRDSQRLSDLASVRTAVNYYIANTSSPVLGTSSTVGCTDQATDYTYSHYTPAPAMPGTTGSASSSRAVTSAGWIPIDLDSLTGGAPLSSWPVDPNPSSTRYYTYLCNATNVTFEVLANMESSTYADGGPSDVESKDGGNIPEVYEVGTAFIATTTVSGFYQ